MTVAGALTASARSSGYDPGMTEDPFPRERVTTMVRRMPAYLRLAWRLAKEPMLSKARRAAVVGAAGYLASPIDLVPGVIPVLGQLDDLAVALAAIRLALAGLSPERRAVHLEAVGLGDQDLTDDLRTVGATTAWIGRASFRTTKRAAAAGTRVAGSAARTTRSAVDRATPMARATSERVTPAAKAAAAKAVPAAKATGRAAKGAGAKAVKLGRSAAGATIGRLSKSPDDQAVTVSPVDVPLLPPPAPRSDG
jgi:uncharacterized membrane protein YkvA (DUF1232 family)